MRYKYQKIRSRENPSEILLEPIIPVGLRYGDKVVFVTALIDSGAELCLFHSSIAKSLGIDLENGRKVTIRGLSPDGFPAYVHKVFLALKDETSHRTRGGVYRARPPP
jgi:hypothetical protein